jgi:hypothetical protein
VAVNYNKRRHQEMLDDLDQLHSVYTVYGVIDSTNASLPLSMYDYTKDEPFATFNTGPHPLALRTAGNWDAPYILVGDKFGLHKDQDTLYQWPFASFSNLGCSRWLTRQLHESKIPESDLLWVNADQDLTLIPWGNRNVIALGKEAYGRLKQLGVKGDITVHPQSWKRFHAAERYPLIDILRGGL